ncbi:MAG TPA: AMP-binding protein [Acidimicrobiales bacterium]
MTIRPTRLSPTDWTAKRVFRGRTSGSFLDECVQAVPDEEALIEGSHRLTYAQLGAASATMAAGLSRLGAGPGDVVTMQLPNWWEASVVYQALCRLGCVVNPVVPIYRQRELGFIIEQATPRAIVIPHRFRGFDYVAMVDQLLAGAGDRPAVVVVRAEGELPEGFVAAEALLSGPSSPVPPEAADPDDICLLLYTSGTTADPKGVLHSHNTLVYEVSSIIDICAVDRADTVFMPSPVTHITGFLFGLLMPPMLGMKAVFLDVWDPATAVDVVERETCRFTMGATPFLHGMVDEHLRRGHPSALTLFMCGGADVPPPLVRQAAKVLDAHVARIYGSSEFPTFCCGRPGDDLDVCADTDGMPLGPVECRLDNETDGVGELLVKGPELFAGYLDASLNDAAFSSDGYFRTGDLASLDSRGAVTIRGRQKDIIVRGGENISAKEVEDVLFSHPLVSEVAVVAMPDPVLVERVCAFVVPVAGGELTLADLVVFLDGVGLARQKYPERLELVAELPTTASGKVQKFVLRQLLADRLARGEEHPAGSPR